MNFVYIHVDQKDLSKEKQRARELRQTHWWKLKIARGLCEYCNNEFPPEELTMDHIVPLSRGGKSVKNNVCAACKECNSKKKYLLPMEWDDYLKNK